MALNKFSQYPNRTELNPTPSIEQTNLVAVAPATSTTTAEDILVPAQELIPGVAYNSEDGSPKMMISGEVWNEQEQIREAFTADPAFILPHFRYVADDYLWKSIVGDKAFYYLSDMKLLTWPLAWTPGSTTPALHLSWLRAPEQTQIFKFNDGDSATELGSIILQNRTYEMVNEDPDEVRVNRCSTSRNLKEVQCTFKSTDTSPIYVNFPGADVSLTFTHTDPTANTDVELANSEQIMISSDSESDVAWRTLTINTRVTALTNMLRVTDGSTANCSGTVYLNAPSATSVTDCFDGTYTAGNGVPDVRLYIPAFTGTSLSFYTNFPIGKESIVYLLNNIPTGKAVAAHGTFQMLNSTELTAGVVKVNGYSVPAAASASAAVTAINADTNLKTLVTASYSGTTVTLTAKKKGTTGNLITLTTSDSTNFPVSGSTFTGGLNQSGSSTGSAVLDLGIDTALGASYDKEGETPISWMPMDEDIQKLAEDLDGIWAINWHPVAVEGGGITVEYQIYDYIESNNSISAAQYIDVNYHVPYGMFAFDMLIERIVNGGIDSWTLTGESWICWFVASGNYSIFDDYNPSGYLLWDWNTRATMTRIATTPGTNSSTLTCVTTSGKKTSVVQAAGSATSIPTWVIGRRDRVASSQKTNMRYFARTAEDGSRIGIKLGRTAGDGTSDVTWEANLLPCKYIGSNETYKDWPGLYDTERTNPDTTSPFYNTHFFPASSATAFTCHYEIES